MQFTRRHRAKWHLTSIRLSNAAISLFEYYGMSINNLVKCLSAVPLFFQISFALLWMNQTPYNITSQMNMPSISSWRSKNVQSFQNRCYFSIIFILKVLPFQFGILVFFIFFSVLLCLFQLLFLVLQQTCFSQFQEQLLTFCLIYIFKLFFFIV